MNKQGLAVSVISGWGTDRYDVISGVIVPGRIVVKVDNSICSKCSRQLKSGDLVALVRLVGDNDPDQAYHLDCLPDDYGLAPSTETS